MGILGGRGAVQLSVLFENTMFFYSILGTSENVNNG